MTRCSAAAGVEDLFCAGLELVERMRLGALALPDGQRKHPVGHRLLLHHGLELGVDEVQLIDAALLGGLQEPVHQVRPISWARATSGLSVLPVQTAA